MKFSAVQVVEDFQFSQSRGLFLPALQSGGHPVLTERSEHHPRLHLGDGLQVPRQLHGDLVLIQKLHLLRDEESGKVFLLLEAVLRDPLALGGDDGPQLHLHLVISLACPPVDPDLSEVGSSGGQPGGEELFLRCFHNKPIH